MNPFSFYTAPVIKRMQGAVAPMSRFISCKKAVSAIEFALILPLMLALYIGIVEITQLATVDRKVTLAAATVGDLVSRSEDTISISTLVNYLNASRVIMSPYEHNTLSQVITAASVDENGAATVLWSYGYQGGVAKSQGSSINLPSEMADVARNSFVIISGADYPFTVATNFFFSSAFNLGEQQYFLVRNGETLQLD